MFSFQQSDELVFHQIPSSISFQQQARNQQDLIVDLHDHVTMDGITYNPFTKARKLHLDHSPSSKPNSTTTELIEDIKDEHTKRKLVHRELERQRRKDMAKLCASLRGLLPLEFLKGKRSTSDHMHQAVNYIKHMQEKVRVLSVKRDMFKKFVETTSVPCNGTNINDKRLTKLFPNTVSISSCNAEIQILINSCSIEDGFPLSRVLKAISESLNVITYTCTKVNQRLIHSIRAEILASTSSQVIREFEQLCKSLGANSQVNLAKA